MDIQTFLLAAVNMEHQAEVAYEQLTAQMAQRGNLAARTFFSEMAGFSRLHCETAMRRAGIASLEALPATAIAGGHLVGENAVLEYADDPLTLAQAMEIALEAEHRAMELYQAVADTATDPAVRTMATQFAAEEAEHVAALQRFYAQQTAAA